jgi:protein-S-isoprenylcysteine O-methyltransferase Ste14
MKRAPAIVGSVFFLLLAPGTVAGLVPWWISRWRMHSAFLGFVGFRILGVLLIVAGITVLLDSFSRFALQGQGTPAPVLPTQHLVVSGLYRYVRNPMYVGVATVIFGQGLLLGDQRVLTYGAWVWLAFHLFVIGYEEPTLRRQFGADYASFCAKVPRWLPRLRPWSGG